MDDLVIFHTIQNFCLPLLSFFVQHQKKFLRVIKSFLAMMLWLEGWSFIWLQKRYYCRLQNRQPLSKLRVGNCRYEIACKFPSCQYYLELFITKRGTVLFLSGKLENKFMYWILSDQLTIHNLSHYAWKKKNSKTDKKIKIKNVYPRLTSR